ncbi:hypothetical protein ACOME3_004038 [Neoechinorhynchus agilis]
MRKSESFNDIKNERFKETEHSNTRTDIEIIKSRIQGIDASFQFDNKVFLSRLNSNLKERPITSDQTKSVYENTNLKIDEQVCSFLEAIVSRFDGCVLDQKQTKMDIFCVFYFIVQAKENSSLSRYLSLEHFLRNKKFDLLTEMFPDAIKNNKRNIIMFSEFITKELNTVVDTLDYISQN